MNTKQKGEISEAVVIAELLKLGKSISKPFGDNQPYDLIVDDGNSLKKIQIKTGRLKNGCIFAHATRTVGIWKNDGTRHREKYGTSIDAFIIYSPDLNKCYYVPANEATGIEFCLRISPTKNNQSKNVTWAKEYELK